MRMLVLLMFVVGCSKSDAETEKELADKMCACKTADCAREVDKKLGEYLDSPSRDKSAKTTSTFESILACRKQLTGN